MRGFSPHSRTTLLSAASVPTGTDSCGTFGTLRSADSIFSSTSLSRASFAFTSSESVLRRARSWACSSPFSVRICSLALRCSARSVSLDWMSWRRSAASASMGARAAAAPSPRAARRRLASSRFAITQRRSSKAPPRCEGSVLSPTAPRHVNAKGFGLRLMADERNPADAGLLEAFRAGDAKAFEALVKRYQRSVLAIARRFAADADDAEDLAQRAFINAAERAGGWRGGSFKSWLFRIVINLAKNHVRDTSRFDRSEEAQEREAAPVEATAEARIEEAQQQRALREGVAQLPKRQREVLLLRIDADLPFAEIASALGITEVNAKVNFHHAVQKLKQLVKRE